MNRRMNVLAAAIAHLAIALFVGSAVQAQQVPDPRATLSPTGKLRAALIVSNPVLVTRRPDGGLGGVSVDVARALDAHIGVPGGINPYATPVYFKGWFGRDA